MSASVARVEVACIAPGRCRVVEACVHRAAIHGAHVRRRAGVEAAVARPGVARGRAHTALADVAGRAHEATFAAVLAIGAQVRADRRAAAEARSAAGLARALAEAALGAAGTRAAPAVVGRHRVAARAAGAAVVEVVP